MIETGLFAPGRALWLKSRILQSLALVGLELKRKESAFEVQRTLCQKAHPVIFDVGAHTGETSTEYRRRFPDGKIYAFEPFPDTFRVLKRCFSEDNNIIPFELALSNYSGSTILHSNRADSSNSLLETANSADLYWGDWVKTIDSITIQVETLNNFCNDHSIDRIDILKIDAQGSELNILRGALDMLRRKAIDLLYFEIIVAPTYVNQPRIDEYFSFLYALGYRVVDLYELYKQNHELLQMDGLFAAR
jgi:FkbM family methyltransferase